MLSLWSYLYLLNVLVLTLPHQGIGSFLISLASFNMLIRAYTPAKRCCAKVRIFSIPLGICCAPVRNFSNACTAHGGGRPNDLNNLRQTEILGEGRIFFFFFFSYHGDLTF